MASWPLLATATLAATTHDFEAHYTDALIGPLPEAEATYVARSPVTRASEMRGSVLLIQGLDDPVVPPGQARAMAEALGRSGAEVELVELPGEGHGLRRLESLVVAYEAERAPAHPFLEHQR